MIIAVIELMSGLWNLRRNPGGGTNGAASPWKVLEIYGKNRSRK